MNKDERIIELLQDRIRQREASESREQALEWKIEELGKERELRPASPLPWRVVAGRESDEWGIASGEVDSSLPYSQDVAQMLWEKDARFVVEMANSTYPEGTKKTGGFGQWRDLSIKLCAELESSESQLMQAFKNHQQATFARDEAMREFLRERVEKLIAARTAWHEDFGVPISQVYANFLQAIGDLTDVILGIDRGPTS